ncbi:MAG TPA: NPCBM/NEW2 domain-containing protein, partial [Pirellulaceae bacterium]|nr:NPCBM/NEW2 domain-containing protein [Pirellulaceae bacterium]
VRFAVRSRLTQSESKPESKDSLKTESTIDAKTNADPDSKTAPQPSVHEHKLPTPLADNDQFVVMLEGRVETIAGVLAGITDERLTFEHDGRERSVPISQVFAIVLAGTPEDSRQGERANRREAERRDVRSTILLSDGSQLSTTNWTLREGSVRAELAGGSELVVAAREVRRVEIDSWRLTHLSALKPATFREWPLVAPARGWRVDRSLDGNPLRVDGREHARGIALAGGAEAEFEVTADATSFEALVGIDDETEGRGDCVATVSVDGRPVYSQRLRGGEAARKVRVELAGAKRMRLAVEPGAGLDLGDHVDWCDARILRERRETRDSREDR